MDTPIQGIKYRTVTVETNMNEPGLVPAAFDLMRLLARASGLSDVYNCNFSITLEFGAECYASQVTQLNDRLDQMWLGAVTEVKVKE